MYRSCIAVSVFRDWFLGRMSVLPRAIDLAVHDDRLTGDVEYFKKRILKKGAGRPVSDHQINKLVTVHR